MNGSINKVILIGNLGKDPDVRRLENGAVVASFPLATSEIYTDKQSGEKKQPTGMTLYCGAVWPKLQKNTFERVPKSTLKENLKSALGPTRKVISAMLLKLLATTSPFYQGQTTLNGKATTATKAARLHQHH